MKKPQPTSNSKRQRPFTRRSKSCSLCSGQVPEIVTRIDRMKGLMIQPAAEPDSVMLFHIDAGRISEPIPFLVNQPADSGKMHSMEARLQEALAAPGSRQNDSARYDGTARDPQALVLPHQQNRRGLFRRSLRRTSPGDESSAGLSRVFRGEKAAPDLSESAKDYWIFRHKEGLETLAIEK